MEEIVMIQILNRLQILLKNNDLSTAKDYIQLEIDNLNNITQERCKKTKYHFYPTYCKYCDNLNCADNQNKCNKE